MPSMDRYRSYAELRENEREDIDFRIFVIDRAASVAVIAPHGGKIEPGTSEIARAIAGTSYSLYCFEGLRRRPHRDLHITSTNFDEPRCQELIKTHDFIVSVHGMSGDHEAIDVGGRDIELRDGICQELDQAGFAIAIVTTGAHAAINEANVCNRGRRRSGAQLEITRSLRDTLTRDSKNLRLLLFADAVRRALVCRKDI